MIQVATSEALRLDVYNAGLRFFFHQFDRWNGNAVRLFVELLDGASANAIAEELGITVRAVHKAMKAHAMSDAVAFIESLSQELNICLSADVDSHPVDFASSRGARRNINLKIPESDSAQGARC